MGMKANSECKGFKKTIFVFVFLILSLQAFADGWSSSEPYHQTLYVDTLTSKNDASAVNIADSEGLFVTTDIKVLGNIGIGVLTPAQKLDVDGQIHSTGDICTDAAGGKCLSTVIGEVTSYWNASGNDIFNLNSGNVGIGTSNPGSILSYSSSEKFFKSVHPTLGSRIVIEGGNGASLDFVDTSRPVNSKWMTFWWSGSHLYLRKVVDTGASTTDIMTITDTGDVGIGVTPTTKLDVAGQIKLTGGSPGAGKVLTSDAAGLASWVTPSSGIGGSGAVGEVAFFSSNFNLSSDSGMYWDNSNKRIGIGTASPSTSIHTTGQITSGVSTGTAPLVVSSTTKVANLNADLLDGLDSSSFGDATAANQNTILGRIGTSADGAGTSTLFAHAARIYNQVDNGYSAAVSLMGIGSAPACPGGWTDITGQVSAGSFAPVTSINTVSISPVTSMKSVTFCDGGGPNIVVYGCGGGATATPLGTSTTYNVASTGSTTTYTLFYRVCALPR